ncbi:MAG: hypothetical protein FJ271_31080 [Planctomycetes bacterium]|nr:hypothetical protein [Planctomycetota bacterium]
MIWWHNRQLQRYNHTLEIDLAKLQTDLALAEENNKQVKLAVEKKEIEARLSTAKTLEKARATVDRLVALVKTAQNDRNKQRILAAERLHEKFKRDFDSAVVPREKLLIAHNAIVSLKSYGSLLGRVAQQEFQREYDALPGFVVDNGLLFP